MVKYSELDTILNDTGIPSSEYHIEDYDVQFISIPSIAYAVINTIEIAADGISYIKFLNVRIELLTNTIGFEEQKKVEKALEKAEIFYSKDVDFDESNKLFSTTYDITVLQDDSSNWDKTF